MFFSEEKNQKTFALSAAPPDRIHGPDRFASNRNKGLLLLFL